MLRPPTALSTTFAFALSKGWNWLPQPHGHVPWQSITVESPAIHTVIFFDGSRLPNPPPSAPAPTVASSGPASCAAVVPPLDVALEDAVAAEALPVLVPSAELAPGPVLAERVEVAFEPLEVAS
jgi:hypothetical protein